MKTIGKIPGKIAYLAIVSLLTSFLFNPATINAASPPHGPESTAVESEIAVEPLVLDKRIDKTISVGELHSYTLKLNAWQSAAVQIEKQGVAVTATVFSPDKKRISAFGSIASNIGTQQVDILAESAGLYTITVRALIKPAPPGRYLIRLEGLHEASNDDLIRHALQSCEEKPWRDSENNFLVKDSLGAISRCLGAVAHRLEKNSPQIAKSAGGAKADLDYLSSRWHWGEFVSEAYRESLEGDFRMLASAAGEPDGKMAASIVKGVVEDLKIKADNCRKSNRGLGDDVDVIVRTKKESRKVDGLYVYYKLGIYAFKKEIMPPTGFDGVSSPAHKKLPASWYLIWAGKPGEPEPPLNRMRRIEVEKEKARDGYDLLLP
jgi:hypothetical protein